jgi:hypothetical protein
MINRYLVFMQNGLFFWKESVDPIAGTRGPDLTIRKISTLKIGLALAAMILVLLVGVHQIIQAEIRLNDPTIIPEYRVWTE